MGLQQTAGKRGTVKQAKGPCGYVKIEIDMGGHMGGKAIHRKKVEAKHPAIDPHTLTESGPTLPASSRVEAGLQYKPQQSQRPSYLSTAVGLQQLSARAT